MTSLIALAALFSGTFSGLGNASDANGWTSPCAQVWLVIRESEEAITFTQHGFNCGAITANHDAVTFEKRGADLYYENKKVGSRTDAEIDAIVPSKSVNDLEIVYRIIRKGDQLIYRETWLSQQDGGFAETFDMDGTLSRVP